MAQERGRHQVESRRRPCRDRDRQGDDGSRGRSTKARSPRSSCRKARRTCRVNQLIAVIAGEGRGREGRRIRELARAPQRRSAEACWPKAPQAEARTGSQPTAAAPQAALLRQRHLLRATVNGRTVVACSSPLAPSRLAKEAGIDHRRGSTGTGPHGRVVARDVEGAKSRRGRQGSAAAPSARPRRSRLRRRCRTTRSSRCSSRGSYEIVPHDNVRTLIARRLSRGQADHPAFLPDGGLRHRQALMAAREEINNAAPKDKDGKPAWKLSVNDFVIKALASRCSACPMPTPRGPKAACSCTSIRMSAWRWPFRAA